MKTYGEIQSARKEVLEVAREARKAWEGDLMNFQKENSNYRAILATNSRLHDLVMEEEALEEEVEKTLLQYGKNHPLPFGEWTGIALSDEGIVLYHEALHPHDNWEYTMAWEEYQNISNEVS